MAERSPSAALIRSGRPYGLRFSHDDVMLLACLGNGHGSEEIGRLLDPAMPLRAAAVRNRIQVLRLRMEARNRCHMVTLAIQWKVLKP